MSDALWAGVDRLIDRSPSLHDLRAHRLHLLAARRWRVTGREVPPDLALEELIAVQKVAAARTIIQAVREAYTGQILLLKGLEAAACYPDPALRPTADLDILVDDAEEAQRALRAAGFESVGRFDDDYYVGLQHMRPLCMPGQPALTIEVHRWPNWVTWLDPPPTTDLLTAASEGSTGVAGVLALPPAKHAVVLAAHSWGERPLRRVLDLVDVAAVTASIDRPEASALASSWGLSRVWDTTMGAVDAMLFAQGDPWSLRIWARQVRDVRDHTVFEDHIRHWISPFWALPPGPAAAAMATALANDLTPSPTETWGSKLHRAREAISHPRRAGTEHERVLGPEGVQPRFKRR